MLEPDLLEFIDKYFVDDIEYTEIDELEKADSKSNITTIINLQTVKFIMVK